jgi:hypothetical protein
MWLSSSRPQNEMAFISKSVYWPSMLKDCIYFAKGCRECQVHAGIQHVPSSELHSIVKPWPFRGWALDVIGEIKPGSSGKHKHILVGIPETIDQGSVFTCQKMVSFANQTEFKLLTSTPYYAQANGQVEAANKGIITLI